MIYLFYCEKCKKEKEINVPVSEYYIPKCKCGKKMKRKYTVPGVLPGALRSGSIA